MQLLLVPTLEDWRAGEQKIEDAADAEDIAFLGVAWEGLIIAEDFRGDETKSATAVVHNLFGSELLFADGEAQVGEIQRGIGLVVQEENVLGFEVAVDETLRVRQVVPSSCSSATLSIICFMIRFISCSLKLDYCLLRYFTMSPAYALCCTSTTASIVSYVSIRGDIFHLLK